MKKNDNNYQASFLESDFNQIPPDDVVSYNELRSCYDLFRLKDTGQLDISPKFQREVVWTPAKQSRFIDSLLKRLPIPSMCFAYDYKKEKFIVIDGLQRISSIVNFLDNKVDFTFANLEDIDQKISGKSVDSLRKQNKDIISKIENVSIPVTILRCDLDKASHSEYIFTIFHRLNTGGVSLSNQEIRNCIYQGGLNTLLMDLDKALIWRKFSKTKDNNRFQGQEQILRFLAFNERLNKYEGKLAKFLNDFMLHNRNAKDNVLHGYSSLFQDILKLIEEISEEPPKSLVVREAMLYGLSANLNLIKSKKKFSVKKVLPLILAEKVFSPENLKEGLSGKDKLKNRLSTASLVVRKYAESCS